MLRRSTIEPVMGTYMESLKGMRDLRQEIERYRTTCQPYLDVISVKVYVQDILIVVDAVNVSGRRLTFDIVLDKDHPSILLQLLQEMEDGSRNTMPLFTIDPNETFFLTKARGVDGLPGGYEENGSTITLLYCREIVDALLYALRFM